MSIIDKKIGIFQKEVLKEAEEKRLFIIHELEESKKKAISQRELNALEKAYKNIQREKSLINRANNESVSKAVAEGRKRLLSAREGIAEAVFAEIVKKLEAYKKTPEYEGFLLELVKSAVADAGEGELTVLLDESDRQLSTLVEKQTGLAVQTDTNNIYGGCRVLNSTKGFFVDRSIGSRIKEERENFLDTAKLSID